MVVAETSVKNNALGPDKPLLIWPADLSDLFIEDCPDHVISRVIATIVQSGHICLLLTKRTARMDGNLTCMKVEGTMVTELHWQGKFRGIDFGAIPFRLEVGKTDRLKDSKGRHIWTVIALAITDKERDAAEDTGQKNKAQLLAAMAKMPGASLADLATEVGWLTKDGKPYRSLVQRLLSALRENKLVKKEAGRWVLTKAGIKAAGTVAAHEELDMPF